MSPHDTDVAIIGAGPAGSTLASLLAASGIDVTLIDKDTFPRDKLCGEFLSYDALPILDLIGALDEIDRAGATRIRVCRLIGSSRVYSFDFPREARGISRRSMDEIILRRASSKGARCFEGWSAETIDDDADRRVVRLRRDDERIEVRARVVVGAWGRWGRFDRLLSRPFTRDRSRRFFGFKRHYTTSDESLAPHDTIDLYSFDHGYLGVNRIESGETNICGLVHASRIEKHRGGWHTFIDILRIERSNLQSLFSAHEPAQPDFLSSEPVVFTPRSVVENGIILLGDASGLIDPLAGNGMAMAIQSATIAAPLLVEHLNGKTDRDELGQAYGDRHRDLFGNRIRWSRRIARLLSRPRLLDLAMATHLPPAVGRAMLERTRATDDQVAELVTTCRAMGR